MRYVMTEKELDTLYKAARTPGVFLGGVLAGYNPARSASEKVWKRLGKKYGFEWTSVRPIVGESDRVFQATPKETPTDAAGEDRAEP